MTSSIECAIVFNMFGTPSSVFQHAALNTICHGPHMLRAQGPLSANPFSVHGRARAEKIVELQAFDTRLPVHLWALQCYLDSSLPRGKYYMVLGGLFELNRHHLLSRSASEFCGGVSLDLGSRARMILSAREPRPCRKP